MVRASRNHMSPPALQITSNLSSNMQLTVPLNRISLQNFRSNQIKQYVDESTTKSLGYLWSYITAPRLNFLYIPKTETLKQTPTLQCIAIVTLNDIETLEYTNYLKNLKAIKKVSKASTPSIVQNPVSVGNYISKENLIIEHFDMRLQSNNVSTLIKSPAPLQMTISCDFKASGQTKHMYDAHIGTNVYAAKCFYNLGIPQTEISAKDNWTHLQNELSRHITATKLGEQFVFAANEKNLTLCNFTFSDSWLAVVKEGEQIGWSYLMAPMLDINGIQKFSGTAVAGVNDSLIRQTMDTFAHFSLIETQGQLVLTDIQGISSKRINQMGYRESNMLTLFDLMMHTIHGTSRIGDDGEQGIEAFKVQHRCNSLCKALHLPELVCKPRNIKHSRAPSSPTQLLDDNDLTNSGFLQKNANLSASSTTPQSTSNNSDILGNETNLTISEISYEFDIEITLWGHGENNNLHEVLPRKGEERKGKLKLWVKEGEIYNAKRLQWWKAQMLDTSVATTYVQGFAFSPYAEHWPGSTLSAEIGRNSQYFDYKLLCIIQHESKESNIIEEYLWTPVSNYSKLFYTDIDFDFDNLLINETFSALSHYSYEESQKDMVHTSWVYMRTDFDKATTVAITTHDQRPAETEDGEGNLIDASYPHNIGTTGIEFWRKSHTCFSTCEALGFTRLV
ncbi:hypothetical protein Clacol_004688 [Clathrus columnatus]|uniref:Alpha-type protein kinase domain-containing protein n=1 Tax=Clathrus columnatus TaxID=1419009 RepID=A0AAV5A9S8_9AGAM|nr:hypothetical protein Clacol_004688 [Clathrus columnatus]